MTQYDCLLGLIQNLYAAPGSYDGWQVFLANLADSLRCSTTQLIVHDFDHKGGAISASFRFDPDLQRQYDEYYASINVFFTKPTALTAPGQVYTGAMLCPDSTLERSEYYNDFFRKLPAYHALGATIRGDRKDIAFVSCLRAKNAGCFGEEADLLRALTPHLQRALQIHTRLVGAEAFASCSMEALDHVGQAVLFLDAGGRLMQASRAAEQLLREADGLMLEQRELRAATPRETAKVRQMIAAAIETSLGNGMSSGGVTSLGRPSGRRPLRVVVAPIPAGPVFVGPRPAAAMILVTDPERCPHPSEGEIRTLFGLTPAEARLTRLLVQGVTLADSAARLGLRYETMRSYLKTIFEKTGTHRQAELIQLVLKNGPSL